MTKLQIEKDRLALVSEERQKKVTEVMAKDAFKVNEQVSIVERLIKEVTSDSLPSECELYNLLATKKANLEIIDKLIEEQFKEKVDQGDSFSLKSEQAKCKLYLNEIT